MRTQILLTEPGDRFACDVTFIDHDGQTSTSTIVAELQEQKSPVILGVKVDDHPVLLRSREIVFNASRVSAAIDQAELVRQVARKFSCGGVGTSFAGGVAVTNVVRFIVEQLSEGGAR